MKKIYSVYAILCAIILLLILFPFVFTFSFRREPKGSNSIFMACHIYAKAWFFMVGIKYIEIQKGDYNPCDQYVYISNHQSYIDILIMFRAMRSPYRPLGKAEMARYPIFGHFYKKVVISVNRREFSSRAKSFAALKETLKQHNGVFIFPEGTFNESDKPLKHFQDGAFQLALKTQTNIKPLIFVDNLQRMHYSSIFTMSPGICRVVFLEEININNYHTDETSTLKQNAYENMHKTLVQYRSNFTRD